VVTQAPRRSALLAALAFTLSCIGLMIFVWTQFGGTVPFAPQGYRLQVRFTNAANLVPGDDVRISGIDVGKVATVKNSGETTLATLDIERQYAPVSSDAHAILRLKTLLGEVFVALSPGSRSAPKLPDGGTLPSTQVEPTQPLDKVLDTLTPRTQRNLDRLLSGISTGLAGEGASLNASLGDAASTSSELDQLATLLDSERGTVSGLVRDSGVVLRAVGSRQSALQSLVTAGERVLAVTAARNQQLVATVNALAPLLPQLRTTLNDVHHALTIADPTFRALIPVAPLLQPTLAELIKLGPPARALLHEAVPLIDAARVALPPLTRVTVQLRSLLHVVLPVGEQLAPMVTLVHDYAPELVDDMGLLAAATSGSGPSAGGLIRRYARVIPVISNELPYGQTTRPPSNRHDAYHVPNGLTELANGGLRSSDCANVHNTFGFATIGSAPPCLVQPGWKFEGLVGFYPHVEPAPAPK
jgi:virulence factor Mce-like protein